jgi:Domain of unknown function (DUF1707)/Domain of unknown function (DUF4190)
MTPDLRASDADRDDAVERLRTAAMEGRLDSDELEERIASAYGARWCSELTRLTADVTPPPPPPALPVFVRRQQRVSGFAVASVACALIWMWGLASVAAIVFGHLAVREIRSSNGLRSGMGIAITGIVLGYLELLAMAGAFFWL